MNDKPYAVERTSREVIEGKLLNALEDGGVAAILSRQDLEDLVFACKLWPMRDDRATRLGSLMRGMEQLLKEAFSPNAEVSEGGTRDSRIATAAQSRPSLH